VTPLEGRGGGAKGGTGRDGLVKFPETVQYRSQLTPGPYQPAVCQLCSSCLGYQ
jgi:hypothetical protein